MRSILGTLFIVGAIGISSFFVQPILEDIQGLTAAKHELESAISRLRELGKIRDGLLDAYNSISQRDLAILRELLPSSPQSTLLLVNVDDLTNQSNMTLKRISIQESSSMPATSQKSDKSLASLNFQISVSGSYNSFRSFLKAVEASRRIIDIEQITFTPAKKDSYEFSLQGRTYWQRQ
jgi:Tfp pilus assembly protein PilO